MKYRGNILFFVFLLITSSVNAQTLTIEIANIRNNKGQMVVGIFKNNDSFKIEKAFLEVKYIKSDLKDSSMTVHLKLEPGIYGISMFDDEDNNGEMKYNFIGIPKEGFGFSDFSDRCLRKPKFKDFDFIMDKKDKVIKVKMCYL